MQISKDITNVGANDRELKLFESQYVLEKGMSYNSYLIKDKKNALLDTIDERVTGIWLQNLERVLDGEKLEYLVISHLEPDHAYNIGILSKKYPNMKIVANQITFNMIPNFFDIDNLSERKVVVMEGDVLDLGKHKLQFIMAPMVHWPEVMMEYEQTEKILFSADAFGKFGTTDADEEWDCEARRYYFGIVGKYGTQVQNVLKKASAIDIKTICPLHGPVLTQNLGHYIEKYDIWSSYKPEDDGVMIACASIHGNTMNAAKRLEEILKENKAKKVVVTDLAREDWAEAVEDAFRYDKLILMASSYNQEVFPPMEQFLHHLKSRNYQKRKVGIIENGSWAPSAGRCMKNILQEMKDIDIIGDIITIKSKMTEKNEEEFNILAKEILK